MKVWSIGYDENRKDNFPQVVYKDHPISIEQEASLVNEIFKIFYLIHRDAKKDIEKIEMNKKELPYRKLYDLVFSNKKEFEFETEYLVELLNIFHVELHNINSNVIMRK